MRGDATRSRARGLIGLGAGGTGRRSSDPDGLGLTARAAIRVLTLAGGGAAAGTVLSLVGRLIWPLDLAAHFQPQYAALQALCMVGLWIAGRGRGALLLVPTLALNLVQIAPLYSPAPNAPPAEGLHLLSFNVLMRNRRFDEVAAYIRASGADIVSLQETDSAWVAALTAALPGYRVAEAQPRENRHGLLLLVAAARPGLDFHSARPIALSTGAGASPAIEASFAWQGRRLALLTMHPSIPLSPRSPLEREHQLAAAGLWARDQQAAPIILGDLNATPWSAPLRRALAEGGLIDSERGFGIQGSFPAWLPGALRLPIDHCLHDPSLVTLERRLGPSLGSDHRALHVTVGWR